MNWRVKKIEHYTDRLVIRMVHPQHPPVEVRWNGRLREYFYEGFDVHTDPQHQEAIDRAMHRYLNSHLTIK